MPCRARSFFPLALALLLGVSGCTLERMGTASHDAGGTDGGADARVEDAGTTDVGMDAAPMDSGPACGDGRLGPDEPCDGDDLAGADCTTFGARNGTLRCAPDCTFDVSACLGCGNGRVEEGEECDGADLSGLSCVGGLSCSRSCALDYSACTYPSAGDGSDGTLSVTSSVHLDGSTGAAHYPVVSISDATITLDRDPTELTVGDEVILINMGGSSADCGSVGHHELAVVSSLSGLEVTLAAPLTLGYGVADSNADLSGQAVVLQRVPHFDRVELLGSGQLTADSWDGSRGGLVAMRTRTLVIEAGASLDVSARGYRGGRGWDGDGDRDGRRGESICGDPQDRVTSANHGGGGGGLDVDPGDACGQGGGGAGYADVGGSEGFPSSCIGAGVSGPAANGGEAYGDAELNAALLGSGGGAGATDDNSDQSGSGGRGGGFILVWAAEAIVDGDILANGGDGSVPGDTNDSGNGGGGSGGAIVLHAGILSGTGQLSAMGGVGPASQTSWNSAGGDGSVGRVRVDYLRAGGGRFGSPTARSYLDGLSTPAPGFEDVQRD